MSSCSELRRDNDDSHDADSARKSLLQHLPSHNQTSGPGIKRNVVGIIDDVVDSGGDMAIFVGDGMCAQRETDLPVAPHVTEDLHISGEEDGSLSYITDKIGSPVLSPTADDSLQPISHLYSAPIGTPSSAVDDYDTDDAEIPVLHSVRDDSQLNYTLACSDVTHHSLSRSARIVNRLGNDVPCLENPLSMCWHGSVCLQDHGVSQACPIIDFKNIQKSTCA